MTEKQIENIARVTHETNRAYCVTINDSSQVSWDDAPQWQRDSAVAGVRSVVDGSATSPEEQHETWLAFKRNDGWVYGPTKNVETKTHPCMVEYHELPPEQRVKDHLFRAIVTTLLSATLTETK
jgi:hypothetical protein